MSTGISRVRASAVPSDAPKAELPWYAPTPSTYAETSNCPLATLGRMVAMNKKAAGILTKKRTSDFAVRPIRFARQSV